MYIRMYVHTYTHTHTYSTNRDVHLLCASLYVCYACVLQCRVSFWTPAAMGHRGAQTWICLRQVQNSFVPDEDLRGRNVVRTLQFFATWKLINSTQLYEAIAVSLCSVIMNMQCANNKRCLSPLNQHMYVVHVHSTWLFSPWYVHTYMHWTAPIHPRTSCPTTAGGGCLVVPGQGEDAVWKPAAGLQRLPGHHEGVQVSEVSHLHRLGHTHSTMHTCWYHTGSLLPCDNRWIDLDEHIRSRMNQSINSNWLQGISAM